MKMVFYEQNLICVFSRQKLRSDASAVPEPAAAQG